MKEWEKEFQPLEDRIEIEVDYDIKKDIKQFISEQIKKAVLEYDKEVIYKKNIVDNDYGKSSNTYLSVDEKKRYQALKKLEK